MPRGRPLAPLALDGGERERLEALSQSTSTPRGPVPRARIVRACAQGLSNVAAAERLGASPSTAGKWRRRFLEQGAEGMRDGPRPGRPRAYGDEKAAALINRALRERTGKKNWDTHEIHPTRHAGNVLRIGLA